MDFVKELNSDVYDNLVRKTISGRIVQIAKTLGLVMELKNYELHVQGDEKQIKLFEPHLDEYLSSLHIVTIERKIPRELCGLIIGKGGQTINRINYTSGAKVKLDNKTSMLTIIGNKEQVDKVETEVDLILRQNVKIEIPEGKYGIIIGKGGRTIKKIGHVSGAKVFFKDGIFSISGKPKCIEKAKKMVEDIINIGQITLNPFEYDKLFNGTDLLRELEKKYNTKIIVNLESYTLTVQGNVTTEIQKEIDDILDDSPKSEDIFEDYVETQTEESDDDLFV